MDLNRAAQQKFVSFNDANWNATGGIFHQSQPQKKHMSQATIGIHNFAAVEILKNGVRTENKKDLGPVDGSFPWLCDVSRLLVLVAWTVRYVGVANKRSLYANKTKEEKGVYISIAFIIYIHAETSVKRQL